MIERRKKLHRILSVVIISFLLVSVLSPVAGLYNDSGSPGTSFNNDGIDPRAEGDYRNITGTVYINTSIEPDYHIIVKSTGKLYINNATLSFLIDGYHPWKLTVENGGELYMWNSTIRTQPDDTQLRPFLKTAVIVTGGSKLVMRHNSAFTFPGWVYIEDGSTFMMQDSRFDQIPDLDDYQHDFNWDGELTAIDEDDNDDCPILHVTDNSKAIIQDSVIDNYYENDVFEQQNNIPSWAPRDNFAQPMSSLTEVDNDYYEISPGDSLEIEDFNMTNPLFPTPDMYPYMNPINKMSSLYIEITYQTEDNYSFMDSLEYETPSGWKNALSIAPTDQSETLASNIWEIPLTNFTFSGDQFLYKIPARLNNSDSGSNANISVDQIRLVSGYENDIHVRNSETVVINSEIDVDFNPSDIDPRPGDNYEEMTTQSNWMEDSNTDHSCFRLMNSGFKAYGIVPTGTSTPDGSPPPEGDPIVAADTASQDKIWIYRWLTVVPRDNTGTAVADTNVTIELEEDFQNVWPNLAAKVQGANDPFNNSDAWEYINKTGIGEYDPINEYYRTKGSGRVLCFAASDRINHPGDWPNSRSVGSYNITADHHILGYADKDVGLTSFPNLTAHSNNVDVELQFDGEIPHPDIAVSDDSLSIMHDGNTVSYVTTDTQLYLNLSVLNAGTENATNVKVNYYLNSVEASNLLGSDTISFLNMTETKVTSISWTPVSTGDYTIMAVADPDDDIPELNEMNNTANQTITVGNKADLVVNDVIVSDNEVMNGETVSVYATIGNLGGTDVDNLNVSFYYDGMTYFDTSFINVPGNTTYRTTETLNFPYPGVGDYTITVIADADDQVEEGNENNNDNTAEVSVLSEPDLIPSGFRILNESGSQVSSVYDGETVTLETRVSNVGGASTSTIPVTFYVDRGEPTQEAIGTIYVSGLTPGSTSSYYSTTWESEMVTPGMTEDRDITVVVNDPYTVTSEQVMGNNYGNISLEIKNPADLSIDSNDIEFSTDKSQVNDPVEITALVYNNGGEDVNTKVTFFKGEISAANIIGEDTISITAGNSTQANITWTPESRGNHEITVYVDYYEDIYETYLTNNFATVQKAIFSTDYRFDLIVNDANTPQSIGTYKSSGYVLVEESGVLNIDGSQSRAQFEMIQDKDNKYSIIVKDQGTLNIDYSMLYSGYYFNVLVMDEGELVIRNRSMVYDMITIQSTDNSTVTIDETSVEGPVEIMGENFYSSGSQYTSDDLYINPSYIECMNASFAANLDDFHDTTGSLTATSTNSISMTGNSEIEIYRWMRITTVSNGSIPISGARVGASSTSTDYSIWRSTNSQGTTYLRLLTDVLTSTESTFVGNYELKAYYLEETDNYTADTISYASPNYPSTTYEQSMTIRFESLWIPDLSITDSDVSTDLSEVTMGDPITITANIMNEGQVDAEDIDVHFYLVQEGEDLLLGTVTQSMIPSLGNETVEFEWISTMDDDTIKEENKTVMVMVDPEIQPLKDANAGNNDAKTNFKVRSPPKLEFLSDNIRVWMSGKTVVNNTVMEMDEVSISIDLMNTGGTYVNNASITLVIDGEVVNRKTVDLPLDKEINFTSKWTAVYDWVETDEAVTLPLSIWLNSSAEDPEYSESISSQIEVEQMTPSFTGVNIPTGKQKSGEFIYVTGYLLRDGDNKPIQGMRVTAYIVDENGDPVTADQETATTNADGEFQLQLVTPEEAGTYSVTLEADHASDATYTTSQSFDVESTTTGLPWWLILVAVLGAVGAVGGVIFYLKWKGAGEWVECGECGATIQADSKVCPKCGTEFEMETVKCSECGEWISMDSRECPHCGAEFITTGKEIQQYGEAMEKQYEKYVDKFRNKAKSKWGENFTEDKFIDWWRRQPSYMTYDQWLEKEEAKRREGGIECPECGTLNSAGAAICQKCGTSLIKVERPVQRTLRTPEEEKEDEEKKEREKEEKLEEKKEVVKKPQRVVKKVKKKPKKVSKGESEESSEESETSTKKPKKVVKKVKKKPKKEE